MTGAPWRPLRLGLASALAGGLLLTGPATGESGRWRTSVDNDYFNFWQRPDDRPDFGYTHGTELTYDGPGAPGFLAHSPLGWLAGRESAAGPARLEVHVRQAIYSPWQLPPDRPYAGWLEAGIGIRRETSTARREAILHVGVTGPPSLADRTQTWIHHRFGFGPPQDWAHQLPYEPGLAIEANGAWQSFTRGEEGRPRVFAGPEWRARAGTYAVDFRFGMTSAFGLDPPRPWGATRGTRAGSIYAIAAARIDAIARDEFLDGTLFRTSAGVSAAPIVPEFESGAGVRWRRARIEWHVVRRGKEYRRQPGPHTYSTLALAWE